MSRCRPLLVALLLALASAVFSQGAVRTLTKEEMKGFDITNVAMVKVDNAGINLVRSYKLDFFNGTREEVESVDIRFWIVEGGKTTFSKSPLRIDRFHDYAFARNGSALPQHAAPADYAISIEHPFDLWNSASHEYFEVVAVRAYTGVGDLRDLGHMYTWLTKSSDEEIARRLRQEPVLATTTYPGGATAVALALNGSTVATIQAMVDAGAALPATIRIGDWDIPPLHLAAANDHPEPLVYMKSRGVTIDAPNDGGHTALDVALAGGHVANARWLLANGADPNRRDREGNPPAFYAYKLKDLTALDALAKSGADLKYHNKGFGLMHLAASARLETTALLDKLATFGVPVNDVEAGVGTTPLMIAASAQNNPAARWLLAHGAKIESRDAQGRDVFDYARMSNTLRTDAFFRREVLDKMPKKRPSPPKGGRRL